MSWRDTIKDTPQSIEQSSWRDTIQEESPVQKQASLAPAPEEERSPFSITASGLAESASNALPIVGGIVGGALGSALGPLGAVGGAGGGYALGARGKDIVDQYLLDKPVEAVGLPQKMLDTGKDFAIGAASEVAGQGLAKAIPAAAGLASRAISKVSDASKAVPDVAAALLGPHALVAKKAVDVAPQAIDATAKIIEKVPAQYKAALSNAVQQGGRAFAIQHFLMSQRDPEYARAVSQDEGSSR